MGLIGDYKNSVKVPFSAEDTFDALKKCIDKLPSIKLDSINELTKTVHLKSSMRMLSWGENITITVQETADGMSEIHALSTAKMGISLKSNNRRVIDEIMSGLAGELKNYPKIHAANR